METETIHLKIAKTSIADVKQIAEDANRKQSEIQRDIFELGLKTYWQQYWDLKKLKALNNIKI